MSVHLLGLAASPGNYVGRAFVTVDLPDTSDEVIEVLVIKTAGIEWLETILRAKAVVTEVGGKTSHAATICRELGKPCVTAIHGATSKLKTGSLIAINGTEGSITILTENGSE